MRIRVIGDGRRIRLAFPNWLVMNRLTARIAARVIREQAGKGGSKTAASVTAALGPAEIRALFRAVRASRRILAGRPLVEVESAEGETVRILL